MTNHKSTLVEFYHKNIPGCLCFEKILSNLSLFVQLASKEVGLVASESDNAIDIIAAVNDKNIKVAAEGMLEILEQKQCGFLRLKSNGYLPSSNLGDVYFANSKISKLPVKTGSHIVCFVSVTQGKKLTGDISLEHTQIPKVCFGKVESMHPYEIFNLHLDKQSNDPYRFDITSRFIEMMCPITKGGRTLIIAPAKSGKTMTIMAVLMAIITNSPKTKIVMFCVDERPEEISDIKDFVHRVSPSAQVEVIASSFDNSARTHVNIAKLVIKKCENMLECDPSSDVLLIIDSLSKLVRAYNATSKANKKLLPGGVSPEAISSAKKIFGAGRKFKDNTSDQKMGSLSVIGSILMDASSRRDEIIKEEFKGTGNSEIVLDNECAERLGVFPAIDIHKSGTRRPEGLKNFNAEAMRAIKRMLYGRTVPESASLIIKAIKESTNNQQLAQKIEHINE